MWSLGACLLLALATGTAAAQSGNCEPLRDQIAAKFKSGGLPAVTLVVLPASQATTGRVVGTCDRGQRKIVQTSTGSVAPPSVPPSAPAARKDEAILTECKDGSVSMGGTCRR